ncbi:outer membrane beta-barrel domain-containing protein [Geobacter pickeringii]|uniref:Membrane protein n=1 Tax=Geobacter pickeringii TaxID=345632 RepID=A0A0B5BDW1_9BACT|nr:outer membrane beta-barrel domain-containing protein [Geobacter pickeringii]AJE02261.1 membrane protein [Geobacter pickeringii]
MKKHLLAGLCALTMAAGATAAHAEVRSGAVSLSPFVGGYTFDGDQHLRTDPTFGLRGGYHLDQNWATELVFGYTPTKETQGQKQHVNAYRYGLDLLYHFMPESRFVPFLAAGFGANTIDRVQNDTHDAYANYGAGVNYFLTDNLALRGDVRHIIVFNTNDNNVEYTAGVNYLFGGVRPAAVKATPPPEPPKVEPPKPEPPKPEPVKLVPPPPAPPLDSDGDGVPDTLDKCPDTPKGVAVDKDGCPKDSDGDGVPDYLDKCPDTPKGVAVDKDGCPKDSDGDGVPDYLDKCPDTPRGLKVDKDGCPEKVSIDLKIEFDTDKAVVKAKYNDEIKRVADFMTQYPETKAVIEGHTDNKGSAAYNLKLSERRAAAVRAYLIEKFGIDASRVAAKGYGLTKPIADNATEAGRQKNRRVIAVIDPAYKKK